MTGEEARKLGIGGEVIVISGNDKKGEFKVSEWEKPIEIPSGVSVNCK